MKSIINKSFAQILLGSMAVVSVLGLAADSGFAQSAHSQPNHPAVVVLEQEDVAPHADETTAQRDARLAWWRKGKFGMFVHWGIYSTTGGLYNGQKLPNSAEWMMCRGKIPIAEYEKYADQFNPTEFNADEFVGLAKEAGMTYLVITAKHHDGFATVSYTHLTLPTKA